MKKVAVIPDRVFQRRITFPNDVTLRGVASVFRSNSKEIIPFGRGFRGIARKVVTFGIILLVSFIILKPAWVKEQSGCLKGVEFLTGYGQAELKQKKDYHLTPFVVDFDFDIKPLTKKIGFVPPSLFQFQIEPFLSLVTNPDTNMEIGTSFLLKLGLLPESWRFQPYVKGGVGMIYMTQHTLEQSTQFNFISHFGAGFHYFFNKEHTLTLEYRFRHLSNAGIKHPNSGIDSHYCLLGITHLF